TDLGSPVMIGLTTMFWWWGNSVLLEHLPRSRRDQMFIAMSSVKLITAPAEPNVAATRTHRAPLERGLGAGGGYKHLAAPRPIHYYPTTGFSRSTRFDKLKNVAQGRFEYSHSPDNRALTKPYPVTTYLVANSEGCNQCRYLIPAFCPCARPLYRPSGFRIQPDRNLPAPSGARVGTDPETSEPMPANRCKRSAN